MITATITDLNDGTSKEVGIKTLWVARCSIGVADDPLAEELQKHLVGRMLEQWDRDSFAAVMRGSFANTNETFADHSHSWTTDLFQHNQRGFANAEINRLQGRMRMAKGARARNHIDLEMMRLGDVVRRTDGR